MIKIIGELNAIDVRFLQEVFAGLDSVDDKIELLDVEDNSGRKRVIEPRYMNFRFESNLLAERVNVDFQKSILVRRFGEEFSDFYERVVKMGGEIYPVRIELNNVGMKFKYFQV